MRRMAKLSPTRAIIVLLLLSVALTLLGRRVAQPVRNVAGAIIALPGEGIMYFVGPFKEQLGERPQGGLSAEEASRLRQENQKLWASVYAMVSRQQALWQQMTMVNGLRARFKATSDLAVEIIPARVVADSSLPYGASPLIDAGSRSGARWGAPVTSRLLRVDRAKAIEPADAPVVVPQVVREHPSLVKISGAHLVGRLTETGEFTARLQLVSDPGFEIAARIRRLVLPKPVREVIPSGGGQPQKLTGANCSFDAVAIGDGKGSLLVHDVPRQRQVRPRGWLAPGETQAPAGVTRPGDVLITRGDDPDLPVEIAIGEVVEIINDPAKPGFQTLRVEPYANLSALVEVYVILPRGRLGSGGGGH